MKSKRKKSNSIFWNHNWFFNHLFGRALVAFIIVVWITWTFSSMVPFKVFIPYLIIAVILLIVLIFTFFYYHRLNLSAKMRERKISENILLLMLVVILIVLIISGKMDLVKDTLITLGVGFVCVVIVYLVSKIKRFQRKKL